jgi:pimeloyl-ACP methyl ester carboxylesterase
MLAVRARLVVAVVAVALGVGACSTGDGGSDKPAVASSTSVAGAHPAPLIWAGCGGAECASLAVPLVPGNAAKGTIELALARHRATGERIGTLLANPGGPGPDALWVAQDAEDIFPSEILDHFDVVAWDPRGVESSTGVECGDQLDYLWAVDHSPDTASEVSENIAAARRFDRDCEARSARLLPYVSSRETVHDMDAIRRALGEEKITYFGFSYGTYLGFLYANAYPTHVRAMVLDGAIDPTLSWEQSSEQQAAGFDDALDDFLAACSRDRSCAFHSGGHAARAYKALMDAIDAEPLYAKVKGETRSLGPGETDLGVADALYAGRTGWTTLARALAAAAQGDGSKLLTLSDDYTGRRKGGTYSNETAAFYAISCLDGPNPPSLAALEVASKRAERIAPHFGASTMWLGVPCINWPAKPEPAPRALRAKGAPPILVLGTTHDPATPLAWGRALVGQLDSARLAVFDGEGHTAYGRGSVCINDLTNRYLLTRELPKPNTVCD